MARFKYWPQAYPSRKFDSKKDCVAFMSSGKIPYRQFFTYIGCFIVRQNLLTGELALFEFVLPQERRRRSMYYPHYPFGDKRVCFSDNH